MMKGHRGDVVGAPRRAEVATRRGSGVEVLLSLLMSLPSPYKLCDEAAASVDTVGWNRSCRRGRLHTKNRPSLP